MPSKTEHPSGKGPQGPHEPSVAELEAGITKIKVQQAAPPRHVCDVCVRPIFMEDETWLHWDPTFDIEWPTHYAFDDRHELKDVTPNRNPHKAVPRVFEYSSGGSARFTIPKTIPVKKGGAAA